MKLLRKKEINKKPYEFSITLSKVVQHHFLKAIEEANFDLLEYLIHTDKKYAQPNFKDGKLINLLNDIQRNSSLSNSVFEYIFNKTEFKEVISYDLAKRVIQCAIIDNYMPIIKLVLHESQFLEHFQTCKCFARACEHGNTELLEIFFSDQNSYTNLSEESLIRNCVFEIIDRKNFDTLFYLLYEKNIEITDNIHKLCSKHTKSKDMLEQCINFKKLDNNVTVNTKEKMQVKKKI